MRVAVLGAGHGGLATAGHISLKGHSVNLFSFFRRELEPVFERGGIECENDVKGTASLNLITSNIDEAINGVDVILCIMPALAHKNVAALLAGCIDDGQVLLLSPARTGGALEVYQTFRRYHLTKKVILGECQTFLYATESRGPAHVEIMKVKNRVRAAALPATDNDEFISAIKEIYPEYALATNVLETSINNTGAVVHPAPMLMNSGQIERAAAGEDIRYYRDVISKFICDNIMEKIDEEKSAVAEAFGVPVFNVQQWYQECYGVQESTLYDTLQNNKYYLGFSAPNHVLGYHHVLDEVPNSLVPIADFGKVVGIKTPMTDSIINLATATMDYDFWNEGRKMDNLGLENFSKQEILDFVNRGKRFWEK